MSGVRLHVLGKTSNVSQMTYSAVAPGAFCRIACHPLVPNIFSGILGSNSVAVYVGTRFLGSSGILFSSGDHSAPGYQDWWDNVYIEGEWDIAVVEFCLQIVADIKFKNIRLFDSLLCWDLFGVHVVVCRHDLEFLVSSFGHFMMMLLQLIQFGKSELPASSLTAGPNSAHDLGFVSESAKEPSRVRREVKVVAQSRLSHRPNSAAFLKVTRDGDQGSDNNEEALLCFGQDGGNITVGLLLIPR